MRKLNFHKLTIREQKLIYFWCTCLLAILAPMIATSIRQALVVPKNQTILVEQTAGTKKIKVPSFVNDTLYTKEGILTITSYAVSPDVDGNNLNLYFAYNFQSKIKRHITPESILLAYFTGTQLNDGNTTKLIFVRNFPDNYAWENTQNDIPIEKNATAQGIFGVQLKNRTTPVILHATDLSTGKEIGVGTYTFN